MSHPREDGRTNPQMELGEDAIRSPNEKHVAVLRGWMLYPDDPKMRKHFIDLGTVDYWLDRLSDGAVISSKDTRILVALAQRVPPRDDLHERSNERTTQGCTAGMILHNAGLKARRGEENVLSRVKEEMKPALSGRRHSNSSHIETVWKTFRSVAHLWAAWIHLEDRQCLNFPCELDHLPTFLAVAEGFRTFAESQELKTKKRLRILRSDETVRLAPEVVAALPPGSFTVV